MTWFDFVMGLAGRDYDEYLEVKRGAEEEEEGEEGVVGDRMASLSLEMPITFAQWLDIITTLHRVLGPVHAMAHDDHHQSTTTPLRPTTTTTSTSPIRQPVARTKVIG